MSKKQFAVIGHPIGHTMSPFIHKRLFEIANIDAEYSVFDIAPNEIAGKYSFLRKLDGYNITIPHKQAIIPYLDKLDKKAKMYGSVNTVKNGEIAQGYTTDPIGFLKALENANIDLQGNVLIIGTGGVARTMAYEAALAGCHATIAVRFEDISVVASLAGELLSNIRNAQIDTCFIDRIPDEHYDLLVNATPLGMYPNIDSMPASEKVISRCSSVFDAVYNPLEIKLLKIAKADGSKALGGISMLVWQAAASQEIWNGTKYNSDDIAQLCEDSSEELKKIFS